MFFKNDVVQPSASFVTLFLAGYFAADSDSLIPLWPSQLFIGAFREILNRWIGRQGDRKIGRQGAGR